MTMESGENNPSLTGKGLNIFFLSLFRQTRDKLSDYFLKSGFLEV